MMSKACHLNFLIRKGRRPQGCGEMPAQCGTENGSALIEFTLVFPIFLLLMLNAVNFGTCIYGWVTVSNAARAAVEYQSYNGVAVGFPSTASFSQVQSLVTTDVSSLRNAGSVKLRVCSMDATGATTCNGTVTGTYSIPSDPEPSKYAIYCADVEYTYQPVFSAFNIPSLHIFLTVPATTIHQQVVMRSMQ